MTFLSNNQSVMPHKTYKKHGISLMKIDVIYLVHNRHWVIFEHVENGAKISFIPCRYLILGFDMQIRSVYFSMNPEHQQYVE